MTEITYGRCSLRELVANGYESGRKKSFNWIHIKDFGKVNIVQPGQLNPRYHKC